MVRRTTRVKICGVMRPEDAAAACRLGADAIGIIFHEKSRRNVSVERAAEIVAAVTPFVTPVGVFVDADTRRILDTAAKLGLRTVQLNGEQDADDVEELAGLNVIKAIRVTRGGLVRQLDAWRERRPKNLIGVLMEPGTTSLPGGSGEANDWDEVVAAQKAGAFGGLPLIAAGGLKPENVADVVARVRPYAVDVATGVEERLGEKSEAKLEQFIRAATSV